MKFAAISSVPLLALLVTNALAIPGIPEELTPRIYTRQDYSDEDKTCAFTGYCECEYSDESRCSVKQWKGKCRCPDVSDVNPLTYRLKAKCIPSLEFGDRHHCAGTKGKRTTKTKG